MSVGVCVCARWCVDFVFVVDGGARLSRALTAVPFPAFTERAIWSMKLSVISSMCVSATSLVEEGNAVRLVTGGDQSTSRVGAFSILYPAIASRSHVPWAFSTLWFSPSKAVFVVLTGCVDATTTNLCSFRCLGGVHTHTSFRLFVARGVIVACGWRDRG